MMDGSLYLYTTAQRLVLNTTVKCLYVFKLRRMVIKLRSMSLFIAHEYTNKLPMHSALLIWANSLSAMRTRFFEQCAPVISNGYCSFWCCIFLCHCVLCPVKLCHYEQGHGDFITSGAIFNVSRVNSAGRSKIEFNGSAVGLSAVWSSEAFGHAAHCSTRLFLRSSSVPVSLYLVHHSARNSVKSSALRTGNNLCYIFIRTSSMWFYCCDIQVDALRFLVCQVCEQMR